MSRQFNKTGQNIRRWACALPLVVLAAAIHAEPAMQRIQATSDIAPEAASKAIAFDVFPAGSSAGSAVVKVLQGASAGLGHVPTTLAEVDQWSDSLTNALRQGGFPVGQVLVTEPAWRAAQQGQPLVFTAFPGRIHAIRVDNKSRVNEGRLQSSARPFARTKPSAAGACCGPSVSNGRPSCCRMSRAWPSGARRNSHRVQARGTWMYFSLWNSAASH